jgi:glycine C-acetyltransferase
LAAATLKGLQLSFYRDDIRHKLWDNVYYFKSEMKKLGFAVQENMVPIVAIKTGSDQNMRRIQHKMIKEQILVSFLQKINSRHPEGNIRTALFASHERVMLDIFLDTLQRSM